MGRNFPLFTGLEAFIILPILPSNKFFKNNGRETHIEGGLENCTILPEYIIKDEKIYMLLSTKDYTIVTLEDVDKVTDDNNWHYSNGVASISTPE